MATNKHDHRGEREQRRPTDRWLSARQLRWIGYCGVAFFSLVLILHLLGASDPIFVATVAVLLGTHVIVYVFSRFTYELTADHLRIRRYVLWRVPLGEWSVRLTQVHDARETFLFIPPTARLLGQVYSIQGVVLVLDTRGLFGRRKVYLTPDSPAQFVEQVRRAAGLPRDGDE